MGYIARFKHGTSVFNLHSSPFALWVDFVPPEVNEVVSVAVGREKARQVSKRRQPFEFSFGIRIIDTSSEAIKAAIDDLRRFIGRAGDEAQPLYFEWKPDNDVAYEPIWGQLGAFRKLKVLGGSVQPSDNYMLGALREKGLPNCRVRLQVDGNILGVRNVIGDATGGVMMDTFGKADGTASGVMVLEATTNKFTNAAFSHATFDTGWSTGNDLLSSRNTDKRYILFGDASAKVTRDGATNATFYQSPNVGNTNTHILSFYVKKQDGSAVTSTDVQPRYGANTYNDATYISLGNGWYWVYKSFAGIASATTTGVVLQAVGTTVYIAGMQLEEKAYPTPLAWGGGVGCAWTGAEHTTTSTRTAGKWEIDEILAKAPEIAEGTYVIIWTPHLANTVYTVNGDIINGNARLWFTPADDKINFSDGTNTVSSSAVSWSAQDKIVWTVTYKQGAIVIYKNGVSIGSGATYTPLTFTSFYLGSSATPDTHINGTFGGVTIFGQALTATEVLNMYTNISAALTAGRRVEWVPGLWVPPDNAAGKLYNHNPIDTKRGWGMLFDIPGSLAPDVWMYIDNTFGGATDPDIYIGSMDFEYRDYENLDFLFDSSSTGGTVSVTTTATAIAGGTITTRQANLMAGRTFNVLLDGDENGSDDLSIRQYYNPGALYYYSDYKAVSYINSGTSHSYAMTPGIQTYINKPVFDLIASTKAAAVGVEAKRAAGTATFVYYTAVWMPSPMLRFELPSTGVPQDVVYDNGKAHSIEVSGAALGQEFPVIGQANGIPFFPNRYTAILSAQGAEDQAIAPSTDLIDLAIYVAPRWEIA